MHMWLVHLYGDVCTRASTNCIQIHVHTSLHVTYVQTIVECLRWCNICHILTLLFGVVGPKFVITATIKEHNNNKNRSIIKQCHMT